ncbi:hypothetical protein MPSEU_000091200 [Mayamaea pseudoterrestris]|nr:hypothetical protein MPSEU_000091200 [Mayamaea pseudoterrestris]
MDIQAILAASDSSDEGDLVGAGRISSRYSNIAATNMGAVDIEQLLRDEDDEDDEDGSDDLIVPRYSSNHGKRLGASSLSKYANFSSTGSDVTSCSHSPDDWAVLQAILQEGDDDEDYDESRRVGSGYKDLYQRVDEAWMDDSKNSDDMAIVSSRRTTTSVDAILLASDDESDDDVDNQLRFADNSLVRKQMEWEQDRLLNDGTSHQSMKLDTRSPDRVDENNRGKPPLITPTNGGTALISHQELETKGSSPKEATNSAPSGPNKDEMYSRTAAPVANPNLPRETKDVPVDSSKTRHLYPTPATSLSSISAAESFEEESERALAHAYATERKLLKSGHREIVSPLSVKRRLRPKVELSARGSTKNKRSNTSMFGTERPLLTNNLRTASRYNFSGVTENKRLATMSESLVSHANESSKVVCGLPTAMALNSKFIAVGTQKGIILLYDLFEQLRQRLGDGHVDDTFNINKAGAITSLDLNFNGDLICAGYSSGVLVLWDSIRGEPLKSVSDAHPSPLTSIRFMSELKLVTVDASGIVNKLTFTRNMIWLTYSLETECLLDGTAGQILAMNVLRPFSTVNPNVRAEALAPVLGKLTLIALSSERSSFVVAVEPSVNVLHRWARPPEGNIVVVDKSIGNAGEQNCLPCLAWGWALISGGQNVVTPILARAWGCCLQLLAANFPTVDDAEPQSSNDHDIHWPAFGVHEEIDTVSSVVALQWLDSRSLVYLTLTKEFTLIDTVMMTLLERIDFSAVKLVYAEFTLSRKVVSDEDDNTSLLRCTTFQNSIRSSDDRIVVLCCDEVRCVSIVGATRRVASLEEDGEWLEALALALDHYESAIMSQEDRKRGPLGRKDLSHQFYGARNDEEEWLAKLLVRYVNLAVDNAPVSSPEPTRKSLHASRGYNSNNYLAQSHFQMLAGVVLEYCVTTRRLDLLFGPIFHRFEAAGHISIFLDVLEPYVLNDKLTYVAPEAMSHFVQHCRASNDVATVERCLLHLDCTMMDFDNLLQLLRANEMFSALFYVYNQGLDDYVTPLEILLERIFDEVDSGGAVRSGRSVGLPHTTFDKLGYKAIVYLRTCFKGLAFPLEKVLVAEDRQQSIKSELLSFIAREAFVPPSSMRKQVPPARVGSRAEKYPYARILLLVDPKATLDSIALGLSATESFPLNNGTESSWAETNSLDGPNKQRMMDLLSSVVIPLDEDGSMALKQSPSLIAAFLDFTATYLMHKAVVVRKEIVTMIISRLVDRFVAADDAGRKQQTQKQMLDLFSALPRDSYQADYALSLIDKADMHRVALLLHQQVASSWYDDNCKDIDVRSHHFKRAIDCYIGDDEEAYRREVFDYVKKECAGMTKQDAVDGSVTLRDALFAKLPALVKLDALLSARLVAELFVDDLDKVVQVLETEGGKSLFRFFRAIISGNLMQLDPVAGSVLHLTSQHHEKYLNLMAKLHPDMVYEYLSTHDNYRLEDCLKLCQKYDIADASAYLLERLGNITSALQLILQTLETRLMNLKRSIRGMGVEAFRKLANRRMLSSRKSASVSELPPTLSKDVENVKRILVVALDLCERNSRTHAEQGSQLWFNVLDRLMNAKGFLRLEKEQPEHAEVMGRALSTLLHLTMQRLVSSVPMNDLVRKITSDSSGSRLGEMREMIESFIKTYGYELRVFQGAANVFRQDYFSMQNSNRRLVVEGAAVRSIGSISLGSEGASDSLQRLTRLDVAVTTGKAGRATVVNVKGVANSKRIENGLISALTRLRDRRTESHGRCDDIRRPPKSSLNMMTASEIAYQRGEFEPVLHGPRSPGLLGEAEHRGRMVTFL